MSPVVYVTFSVILSMFLGWLAVRVIMRSAASRPSGRPSPLMTILAIASWAFLSFVSVTMALSTTTTARTAIIVSNMSQNPPFRSIAASDPAEWERLKAAVSTGVENGRDSDIQKSVIDAVSAELQPYMNRRMSTAPDSVYLALAPIIADGERKSRSMGTCVVVGDRDVERLRRHLDPKRIFEWSETLIRMPPAAMRPAVDPTELDRRRRDLIERAVQAGVPRADAQAAFTPDAQGTERCLASARMLEMAVADTDRRRGIADIRLMLAGLRLPG